MTNELSTEVNKFMMLFVDGSKKGITQKQYDNIKQLMDAGIKGVEIKDFGYIAFHSISRMLDINEYYKIAPEEERPAPKLKELKYETPIRNLENYKEGLKGMIKGLESYIFSTKYQGTQAPVEILKRLEKKLANLN